MEIIEQPYRSEGKGVNCSDDMIRIQLLMTKKEYMRVKHKIIELKDIDNTSHNKAMDELLVARKLFHEINTDDINIVDYYIKHGEYNPEVQEAWKAIKSAISGAVGNERQKTK